jgi:hypothetical protein
VFPAKIGFCVTNKEKIAVLIGEQFFLEMGHIGNKKNLEFYADLKNRKFTLVKKCHLPPPPKKNVELKNKTKIGIFPLKIIFMGTFHKSIFTF